MSEHELRVDGLVASPQSFSFAALEQVPEAYRVDDVSRFHPTRQGDGVALEWILEAVQPASDATYLTLHASRDDFAASIPLDAVRSEGIVVYKVAGASVPVEKGGPFRFLIRDPAACHTDELDDCANVKFVDRIELTAGRGRDTRPTDEEEHEELHRREEEARDGNA